MELNTKIRTGVQVLYCQVLKIRSIQTNLIITVLNISYPPLRKISFGLLNLPKTSSLFKSGFLSIVQITVDGQRQTIRHIAVICFINWLYFCFYERIRTSLNIGKQIIVGSTP